MTWSIKLDITGGRADPETLAVVGTPPDGPVIITGYENAQGRAVGASLAGHSVSTFAPTRAAGPAGGTAVDAGQLARAGYRAYGERTGHKNYRGEPMPTWDELGETIRDAWTHAAAAVMHQARCIACRARAEMEARAGDVDAILHPEE